MEENSPEYFEELAQAQERAAEAATLQNERERSNRAAAHYRKLAEQARFFGWPRTRANSFDGNED